MVDLPRVLLLDDSLAVHQRVRGAFRDRPVRLETADAWGEAKSKLLSAAPPDLLILDLQMPTLDGRTFGRVIKRRKPIPIVVYSSESQKQIDEAVAHIGAEAGVSKSSPDTELVEVVLRLLHPAPAGAASKGGLH